MTGFDGLTKKTGRGARNPISVITRVNQQEENKGQRTEN